MFRQCNIKVENQCEKNIRSNKNGEYKSHCAEICGISIKLLPYSPQSNEKPNVERNDGCIIYKFGFTQNLCGGNILTAKGINKSCPFRKKVSRPKSGPRLAPTLTLLCERTNQSKP